jgi:hypothetical protein
MTPKKSRSRRRSLVGGGDQEPVAGAASTSSALVGNVEPTSAGTDLEVEKSKVAAAAAVAEHTLAVAALDAAVDTPIKLRQAAAAAYVATDCAVCNSPGDIYQIILPGTVNMHETGDVPAKLIINRCVDEDRDNYVTYMVCIKDAMDGVINAHQEGKRGYVRCEKRSWYRSNTSFEDPIPLRAFLCGTNSSPNADITFTKKDTNKDKLSITFTHEVVQGPTRGQKIVAKIYFTPDPRKLREIHDSQSMRSRVDYSLHATAPERDLCRLVCGDLLVALETVDQVLKTQNRENLPQRVESAKWLADTKQQIFVRRTRCAQTGHEYTSYDETSYGSRHTQERTSAVYLGPMGRETMMEDIFTPADYSHQLSCDCGCRVLFVKSTDTSEVALAKFNLALKKEREDVRLDEVLFNLTMAKVAISMGLDVDSMAIVASHRRYFNLKIQGELPKNTTPEFKLWAQHQNWAVDAMQPQPVPAMSAEYLLLKTCLSNIIYKTRLGNPETESYVKKQVIIGSEDFYEVINCIAVSLGKHIENKDEIISGISIFMATLKSVRELFEVYEKLGLKHSIDKSLGLQEQPSARPEYASAFVNFADICQQLRGETGDCRELRCLEMMINLYNFKAGAGAEDSWDSWDRPADRETLHATTGTPAETLHATTGAPAETAAAAAETTEVFAQSLCAVVLNIPFGSVVQQLQDLLYANVVEYDTLINERDELGGSIAGLASGDDYIKRQREMVTRLSVLNGRIAEHEKRSDIIAQRAKICDLCEKLCKKQGGGYISLEFLYDIMNSTESESESLPMPPIQEGDVAMPV